MPRFLVRRNDCYSNIVEAPSKKALWEILKGPTQGEEGAAFRELDESLTWDDSDYEIEECEDD